MRRLVRSLRTRLVVALVITMAMTAVVTSCAGRDDVVATLEPESEPAPTAVAVATTAPALLAPTPTAVTIPTAPPAPTAVPSPTAAATATPSAGPESAPAPAPVAPPASSAALIANGSEVYTLNCARCHGENGAGREIYSGILGVGSRYSTAGLTAELTTGHPFTFGFGDKLSTEEIASVVAYVKAAFP